MAANPSADDTKGTVPNGALDRSPELDIHKSSAESAPPAFKPSATTLDRVSAVVDRHVQLYRMVGLGAAAAALAAAFWAASRLPLFVRAHTPAELAALTAPAPSAAVPRMRRAWILLEPEPLVEAETEAHIEAGTVPEPSRTASASASASEATPAHRTTSPAPPAASDEASFDNTNPRVTPPPLPLVTLRARHVPLVAAWLLPPQLHTVFAGPPLKILPWALALNDEDKETVTEALKAATNAAARKPSTVVAAQVCEVKDAVAYCRLLGRPPWLLKRRDASRAPLAEGLCALDHELTLRLAPEPAAVQWQQWLDVLKEEEAHAASRSRGRWASETREGRFPMGKSLAGRLRGWLRRTFWYG